MKTKLYEENIKTKEVKEVNPFFFDVKDGDHIIKELYATLQHYENRIESLQEALTKAKAETAKDEKVAELIKENTRLKEDYYRGFPISKNEMDAINKWKEKYKGFTFGVSGGGFRYEFYPTALGTSAVIIGPDGDKFQFQELG